MPLPGDYNSQVGEEEAERVIRQAIADSFLTAAGSFGFTSNQVHARPRYPRTQAQWTEIGTIADPDTEDAATDEGKKRVVRYFSVKFRGFRRTEKELTLRYDVTISFGFKDEYATTALIGKNSHDELTGCAIRYGRFLADNLNLGLDDRVTHRFLDIYDNQMIPVDLQGEAAEALFGRLEVVLDVC